MAQQQQQTQQKQQQQLNKISGQSMDVVQANFEALAQLFPSCVIEMPTTDAVDAADAADAASTGSVQHYQRVIDWQRLAQLVGVGAGVVVAESQTVPSHENFGFNWVGKRDAIFEANRSIDKTLRPDVAASLDFASTHNLFIEGDNLEALKLLLRGYSGAVKMIYLDPPYNTGSDFVYNDDFRQSQQEYEQAAGLVDESGKRFAINSNTDARFHSKWCSMMYARLSLLRLLLSDDGVIFISIDDHEQHHLRCICDEVFGEQNFVAQLIWQRAFAPKNDAKYVSNSHDYILMYARHIERFKIGRLERSAAADARYNNPDNDSRGVWSSSDISAKTYSKSNDYEITTPSGRVVRPPHGRSWTVSATEFARLVADNRIYFGKDGNNAPRLKRFLSELRHDGMVPTSLLLNSTVGESEAQCSELLSAISANLQQPAAQALLRNLQELARCGGLGAAEKASVTKSQQEKILAFLDQAESSASACSEVSATNKTLLLRQQVGDSQEGAQELKARLHAGVFNGPKPVRLLRHLMTLANLDAENGDIVLDAFAGSATTAEAVLQANAADGGKRRFIMLQFPEVCVPQTPAAQAGFATIAKIGQARLRNVIAELEKQCTNTVQGGGG